MVRLADVLARWPTMQGDGIGVISGSGGSTGILSDRISEAGLRLARLSPATKSALSEVLLPPQADNPIDLGGRKLPESVEIAGTAMKALASDPDVSIIVLALSSMPFFEARTRLLAAEGLMSGKPLLCSVLPGPAADRPRAALRELGVPFFDAPEDGMLRVLGHLVEHHRAAKTVQPRSRPRSLPTGPSGREDLSSLLRSYGIPLAREAMARNVDAAVAAAHEIGHPVALKGAARDLVHKSDVGAVRLDLRDEAAVREAWQAIGSAVRDKHGAGLDGCLVQEMVSGSTELIVGIRRDPQFGPVVLVGSGGILVELLKDVEVAPAPVSRDQAIAVLRRLRIAPIIDGIRGQPPLDIDAAAEVIERMSWLAADLGTRLTDAEINPLVLRKRGAGAVAVDVRATIAGIG
jgi:acetyl-CoA synthetase (ADP-forming)